ncbi:MAG TPA: FkbM family methyltransferase [Bryobacteraceae bacterium]|nr:FkbM family methyltransferase [Bryobacteraceae bacterium]
MNFAKVPRRIKEAVPEPLKRLVRAASQEDSSQNGEVPLLMRLVNEFECQNFLVDAGANDGITISNSFPFISAGWRGILIEPAPAVFKKLQANHGQRSNVTCLPIACSDKTGEADLYIGSDGEEGLLSSLCETDNEWFRQSRTSQTVKVKTDTLSNILRDHDAPSRPGILLVDCEGMDYEVLLGLEFAQFRPTLIATEEYEWEPAKHAAKYGLLIQNNYSLVQKVGCNTVWMDRSARRR